MYRPYELIGAQDKKIHKGVIRLEDNAHIPEDEHNTDWQAYLAWKADGNVPQETLTEVTSDISE